MTDGVTIVGLADRERWENEHQRGGLPSQSWSYAWGLRASGYEAELAVVESKGARMLLPFLKRQWHGTIDIATLPGLSGAVIQPSSLAPLELWHDFATSQGWIAGYIQISPCVRLDIAPAGAYLANHTQFMFLDLQASDLESSFSRTVRRKIRTAVGDGATLVDDPSVLADSLKRLYPAAMRRVRGHEAFSSETIDRWAHSYQSLLLGVSLQGVIEAVHLGHVLGANAEWHIAGTSERGRSLSALIYWNAILRLRERGIRWFNMGGGARMGDGIYSLKERFGAKPRGLQSIRQIYDRSTYAQLCRGVAVRIEDEWFPAYRQPPALIPSRTN